MKKTLISIAISSTSLLAATSATAAFPDPAIIDFLPGAKECVLGTDTTTATGCLYDVTTTTGSWFSMDADGDGAVVDSEKTPISQNSGLLVNGITIQSATGSHTGTIDGTESPDIDNAWEFFSNTGMHQTTSPVSMVTDDLAGNVTLDFTGWSVTWNGIADIPMGGDTANFASDTGLATMVCTDPITGDFADCIEGNAYTLNYAAHVPLGDASGFGGVGYALYFEGTIGVPLDINYDPVATDDSYTVDRNSSLILNVLANDNDPNGRSDIDVSSVLTTPLSTTAIGTIDTASTGEVTYTPTADTLGTDSFTYQVTDLGGPEGAGFEITSNIATVNITVVNATPVAVNDSASLDISVATSVDVDVTANDTDSDGTINKATVAIISGPTNGIAERDLVTGIITYTPTTGYIGTDSIIYTVDDNDADAATSTSNEATATIIVSDPTVAGLPDNAYLTIAAGNTDGTTVSEPADGNGSWFHMEVSPGNLTFVSLAGFNGVALGTGNKQAGSVAFPNTDSPWLFFGNLGVHQTTSDVTELTDDGNGAVTLDLSGWDVSWNNIASIPMNSGAHTTGFNDGIAQVSCTAGGDGVADCSYGDSYILGYSATVPVGDPSGFGGVKYFVHLEGIVSDGVPPVIVDGDPNTAYSVAEMTAVDANRNIVTIAPGSLADSVANDTGINLTPADVGTKDALLNTKDGEQCIGGCIDFVVTDVTTDYVDLTFKLNKALPAGAVYRKLINGVWQDFDKSLGDLIGSAESSVTGECQGPEGVYKAGLREGYDCIFMRIYDNGPNDTNSVDGTIADPSGALLAGSPNVPGGSATAYNGCSISNTEVSLTERADWLIVAGFISWLGLIGYRRKKTES